MPVLNFPQACRLFQAAGALVAFQFSIPVSVAATGDLAVEDSVLHLPARPSRENSKSTKNAPARHPAATDAEPAAAPVFHSRPGPWGNLDYFTVYLEATIPMLKSLEIQSFDSEWNFVGYSDEQVEKLFHSVELPAAVRDELLASATWRHDEKMVTVVPSREAIEALPAEARARIYEVLGQWGENEFHHEPEIVYGHDVRDWLRQANLREEVIAAIEKTAYRRGKNLVFADTPLLMRIAQTEEERLNIRKALSRTPTLVVSLRLTPESDVAKITEYWNGPNRMKDIAPFLESIAANSGVDSLDLVHLLPPTVRRLLYTFPGQNFGRTGYYPDCHWTSLNFNNFEPLDRLADPTLATAYTLENYTKVTGPFHYGDVIFLMDGNSGNAVHSCVYLADDIVFTKNGRSPTKPWVLMKLEDVIAQYELFYTPQLACYRRKAE